MEKTTHQQTDSGSKDRSHDVPSARLEEAAVRRASQFKREPEAFTAEQWSEVRLDVKVDRLRRQLLSCGYFLRLALAGAALCWLAGKLLP